VVKSKKLLKSNKQEKKEIEKMFFVGNDLHISVK